MLTRRRTSKIRNKRRKKYPWPKNWITSCSDGHCMLCWAETLKILQFYGRPLKMTFRFPSQPCVDLSKRLAEWAGRGIAPPLEPSAWPLPPFRRCNIFICNAKTSICCCYLNGWVSTRCTKSHQEKNTTLKTEILSAPRVSASARHPSCRTPLSSDERQPPNMWQGRDLVENDLGNAQYIQLVRCSALSNFEAASNRSHCNVYTLHLK